MSLEDFYTRNNNRHLERQIAIASTEQRQDDLFTVLRFERGLVICRSPDNQEVGCILYGNVAPAIDARVPTLASDGQRIIVGGGQSGI